MRFIKKIKRCFWTIIIGVFLFCRADFILSQDIGETINQHYQKGNSFYQEGKYKEARDEFEKALEFLGSETDAKNENVNENYMSEQINDILKEEDKLVNIDYKDVPLATILKSFAYSYNLNIVLPQKLDAKVNISLKDVAVEEALEAILTSAGYAYYKKNNLIYVYPAVGVEDTSLIAVSIPLKYLMAAEAENLISQSLSSRGVVRVNELNNTLIVKDYPQVLNKIELLVEEIDTPPLQVIIEAKLVDITSTDLENLGVKIKPKYSAPGGLFKHGESSYEGSDEVEGEINVEGPSSSLGGGEFSLTSFIMKNWSATATLDALIQKQRAHLLASPSIATLNGKEARIVIGEKVPYKEKTQTTTGTTETVKFIDVGTTLRVTPQISPNGDITMSVHPEVSSVNSFIDDNPRITTREADVSVRVKDGETIVIGGLIRNEDTSIRSRVPILGYIPFIDLFFGNRSRNNVQTELAVFITPYIIKDSLPADNRLLPPREKTYINTAGVGERMITNLLFDKARKLELNTGIESRKKDKDTRLAEAIELYCTIGFQFPASDKADEALWRAGKLYFWFYRDKLKAREMFKTIIEKYPRSRYYAQAAHIVKTIDKSLNKTNKSSDK